MAANHSDRKSVRPGKAKANFRQSADAILAQRDRHLAEIELIRRGRGRLQGFAKKAHTLLTRGWAKANWQGRGELIKASAWLLQLEQLRDMLSTL